MAKELDFEWLNGYLTKEDLKAIGITKNKKDWLSLRRWQAHNIATYALGNEPMYGPSKDERFVV